MSAAGAVLLPPTSTRAAPIEAAVARAILVDHPREMKLAGRVVGIVAVFVRLATRDPDAGDRDERCEQRRRQRPTAQPWLRGAQCRRYQIAAPAWYFRGPRASTWNHWLTAMTNPSYVRGKRDIDPNAAALREPRAHAARGRRRAPGRHGRDLRGPAPHVCRVRPRGRPASRGILRSAVSAAANARC